jgi:hypothetical protein
VPNTLAHFGIQGVATRLLVKDADPKWICLGTILPDVPWILRRGVLAATPGIDPIDLRLYSIGQSTLACSLLLAGALAVVSRRPRRTFLVLGLGVLMHLLIDACQTKWGNGVHLLAPLSWDLWNFGLFWPEAWPTHALTLSGLLWFGWVWWRRAGDPVGLAPSPRRLVVATALLAAWLAAPLLLAPGAEAADAHFTATLRRPGNGAPVELDRVRYRAEEDRDVVETWAGLEFAASGPAPDDSATVSVRGRLPAPDRLEITNLHVHGGMSRDLPSYLGLALLLVVWLRRTKGGPRPLKGEEP